MKTSLFSSGSWITWSIETGIGVLRLQIDWSGNPTGFLCKRRCPGGAFFQMEEHLVAQRLELKQFTTKERCLTTVECNRRGDFRRFFLRWGILVTAKKTFKGADPRYLKELGTCSHPRCTTPFSVGTTMVSSCLNASEGKVVRSVDVSANFLPSVG